MGVTHTPRAHIHCQNSSPVRTASRHHRHHSVCRVFPSAANPRLCFWVGLFWDCLAAAVITPRPIPRGVGSVCTDKSQPHTHTHVHLVTCNHYRHVAFRDLFREVCCWNPLWGLNFFAETFVTLKICPELNAGCCYFRWVILKGGTSLNPPVQKEFGTLTQTR